MMAFGAIELLLLLAVLAIGVVVVVSVVGAASPRRSVPPTPTQPQLPGPDPVLARVRTLAWDSREIETPLADALIGYLNEHEHDPDHRAVRNQVGEIAWQHRETCPSLSTLVIDAVRKPEA
ncbi:hypothetical protein GCM10009815_40730 [Nocardioides marmoribigeumensis]